MWPGKIVKLLPFGQFDVNLDHLCKKVAGRTHFDQSGVTFLPCHLIEGFWL